MSPPGTTARMGVVFLVDATIDILDAVCQIIAISDNLQSDSVSQVLDGNITSAHAVLTEPAVFKGDYITLYCIEEIHVPARQ